MFTHAQISANHLIVIHIVKLMFHFFFHVNMWENENVSSQNLILPVKRKCLSNLIVVIQEPENAHRPNLNLSAIRKFPLNSRSAVIWQRGNATNKRVTLGVENLACVR